LDGINTGVEQVRGERPATVMWAQVADAGFAGPAVDEGIDGLGSKAPDGHSPRLVDRTEERAFFEAPELEPGGHGAAAAGRQCGAALAAALADHGEHAGRRFVVVGVQADGLGPA